MQIKNGFSFNHLTCRKRRHFAFDILRFNQFCHHAPLKIRARTSRRFWGTQNQRALVGLQDNKAPGNDGLPKEFYTSFWDLLGHDLVCVLNVAYD